MVTTLSIVPIASGGFAPYPHRGSAPGPRWGTSVPDPLLSRYTPCHYILDKVLNKTVVINIHWPIRCTKAKFATAEQSTIDPIGDVIWPTVMP